MLEAEFLNFYYITHINNLSSILKEGILSHRLVDELDIKYEPIYSTDIVNRRNSKKLDNGKSLWDYANLYFQARNPMLYRVIREQDSVENIIVLGVKPQVLSNEHVYITNGNAANNDTIILPIRYSTPRMIKVIQKDTDKEWWNEEDGSKRKIMAECLVPERIPSHLIDSIYVVNNTVADKVKKEFQPFNTPFNVIPVPKLFFQPDIEKTLTQYLSLLKGDMFFSKMQTLTVSVNCVGVMGKGLASRAKYQFPDVYVLYQDACRHGKLSMGKPYLYKREKIVDIELADEPQSLRTNCSQKWFLLFPTKKHWKNQSDIKGIENGLKWLLAKKRDNNIKSLAIPALGCGLGRLEWKNVGPLLCKYLIKMSIPIEIYLPAEKQISEKYLTSDYLLQ